MNGVLDELVDDIGYWERLYERACFKPLSGRLHTGCIFQQLVWLSPFAGLELIAVMPGLKTRPTPDNHQAAPDGREPVSALGQPES
jgi:hypothetical protein